MDPGAEGPGRSDLVPVDSDFVWTLSHFGLLFADPGSVLRSRAFATRRGEGDHHSTYKYLPYLHNKDNLLPFLISPKQIKNGCFMT